MPIIRFGRRRDLVAAQDLLIVLRQACVGCRNAGRGSQRCTRKMNSVFEQRALVIEHADRVMFGVAVSTVGPTPAFFSAMMRVNLLKKRSPRARTAGVGTRCALARQRDSSCPPSSPSAPEQLGEEASPGPYYFDGSS